MRTTLLISVLTAASVHGEEAKTPSMREKMHIRIAETVPPPQPHVPLEEEPAADVVLVEPMVVSESKVVRDLAADVARKKQEAEADQFSAVKGGRIYGNMGGWWTPESGWAFLKF